jgi:hypothetical protein
MSKQFNEKKEVKMMKKQDNKISVDFMDGAKIEITGDTEKKYKVTFFNFDNGDEIHSTIISTNHWTKTNTRYFINYLITVDDIADNNKTVFHHRYDAKSKNIYIALDSKSLGDTLA